MTYHNLMRRVLAVGATAALLVSAPLSAQAITDTEKNRNYRIGAPMPLSEYIQNPADMKSYIPHEEREANPIPLHSVTFTATAGQEYLVTSNHPALYQTQNQYVWNTNSDTQTTTDRLSNAVRVQCHAGGTSEAFRLHEDSPSIVPANQKSHYNVRLWEGADQRTNGDAPHATWQMYFKAPSSGTYTCYTFAKPYGYFHGNAQTKPYPAHHYPWTTEDAAVIRAENNSTVPAGAYPTEKLAYPAETYLAVDPIVSTSVGVRLNNGVYDSADDYVAGGPNFLATERFSLSTSGARLQVVGHAKFTSCAVQPGSGQLPACPYPDSYYNDAFQYEVGFHTTVTQYTPTGAVCRTWEGPEARRLIGGTGQNGRGHENVRTFQSLYPTWGGSTGCANDFRVTYSHANYTSATNGSVFVEPAGTGVFTIGN